MNTSKKLQSYFGESKKRQHRKTLEQSIQINKNVKILKVGKIPLYVIIVISVFTLTVLQDYIYSRLQNTGFYLSESFLYNTFWLFYIPLTILINLLVQTINPKNKLLKLSLHIGIGTTFSFLHVLVFVLFFILVSNLLFTPPHRFSNMLNTAFSNQFYMALIWYIVFPMIHTSNRKRANLTTNYPEELKLKIGSKVTLIPVSSIQLISTDKPYSIVYTNDQKMLENKSLKEFESELNPAIFFRVHRSAIINSSFVKELKSRNNGDYDAKLENGEIIRFSRHYRTNWNQLLQ